MQDEEQQYEQQPHDVPSSDTIQVTLGESGAPIELSWDGTTYRVVSRPILWVKRERWWERRQPLQEIPVWRFTAVSVDPLPEQTNPQPGRLAHIEVARLSNPKRWQLTHHHWVDPTAEP